MSGRAKFSELPTGTCFDYRGRVYRKLRMNLAEDEERVRAMFPSDVEVAIVELQWRGARRAEGGQASAEAGQVIRLSRAAKAPAVQGAGRVTGVAGSVRF